MTTERALPLAAPAAAVAGATPWFFRGEGPRSGGGVAMAGSGVLARDAERSEAAPGPARFGWIHRPAGGAAGAALVIVPPFGYEAVCAHRSLRALAEAAAGAGLLAIRFDLDGAGDSPTGELAPGRLDAWLATIADACELARTEGAARIVLAGVRLGAALAALAAAARDDVAGLIAIAGVAKGKPYVREARALQKQLELAPPPPGIAAPPEDVHELVGFALPAELRDALARIDLTDAARARRPAPAVLLADRDDLPGNDAWAAALRAHGAEVEQVRLPGYPEMMLDPHHAIVPRAIVDAAVAFARARAERAPGGAAPARSIARASRLEVDGIAEDVIAIDGRLAAIASRPAGAPPRRAAILLNAGSVHHVGPNRLYVALARRLAAAGVLALRVDLSGLGDSATRPGAADNEVYGAHALDDVGACVAWARAQGVREVAVTGLCSGAYHALKAAVAGQPIDVVVPINPVTYFWRPGMSLDVQPARVTLEAQRWQAQARNLAAWRKLVRGEVDVRRVARVLAARGRTIAEHRAREVLRRLRVPLPRDLGTELAALQRAGVVMRFLFTAGDPGHAMLLEQGGSVVPRLRAAGALSIDVIDGPDHTFTPRWSHPLFLDAVARALTA